MEERLLNYEPQQELNLVYVTGINWESIAIPPPPEWDASWLLNHVGGERQCVVKFVV